MLTSIVEKIARAFASMGERGQVLIWVAFFFIIFLGAIVVVVDVGFWLSDRRDAQNDADAMALAAAQELPDTAAATAIVYEWAAANNVAPAEVEKIEFEDADGNPCSGSCSLVRVWVMRNSSILMAQVLNITDVTVRTKAAAIVKPASGVCPFPWAVVGPDPSLGAAGLWGLTAGDGFVFQDSGSGGFVTPGNFGALAVLGNGDSIYRATITGEACAEDGIACGADDTNVCYEALCDTAKDPTLQLGPGDTLSCSTQTGALGGTTEKALFERYVPLADDECDAQSYFEAITVFTNNTVCREGKTSRLGGMFIIDAFPEGGQSSDVQVLGIAWFYISGWDSWGGTGDGETGAPPPYDGIPDGGYVWGYLTDVEAAEIWDLEGIANPFAPVVGVLVE